MLRLLIVLFFVMAAPASVRADSNDFLGIGQALGLPSTGIPSSQYGASTSQSQSATGTAASPSLSGQATNIMAPLSGTTAPSSSISTSPVATDPFAAPQGLPFDYSINLKSDAFGAQLFTGAFARQGYSLFNPDYAIMVGDRIDLRLWGGFQYESTVTVDAQGNIFLPHVGPVHLLGVRNQDLQKAVEAAVHRVFRANVFSYASLAAAQPVRVFVGGFVYRPGLYNGTSMDSLLHYLDLAGGVDPDRGSFLNVQVKRNGALRAEINLYDFLLDGRIPLIQLSDGDIIFVGPRQQTVSVRGLAANAKRFEFSRKANTVADLTMLAKPFPDATHVRVVRNTGTIKNVEYYPLDQASTVALENGDAVEFTADKRPGTISVRVEGEHLSVQEYVLPYGSRIGQLISQIQFNERSDTANIQLFRTSVRERQQEMLQTSLQRLESAVLTARSGTAEESQLRQNEAALILQWVERAKKIEPNGQVMIARSENMNDLLLENGDILKIPALDNLVLVSGEVLFPNSIAYDANNGVDDYIEGAGGYSQDADTSRIILAHRDGSYEDINEGFSLVSQDDIRPGDQIFVLPKVELKSRQIMKEVATMIYQVALGARVVTSFK